MTSNLIPVTADGGFSKTPTVVGEPPVDFATEAFVETAIANLIDTAPDTLNTLNELSAALNDDANFASTVATALGNKADTASLSAVAISGSYDDLTDKPNIPNVSNFITAEDIPAIPTDVSDLTDNNSLLGGGGSSFDQTLNTTDDVVFDSALVGDVSIAGNTIGAVDSDTLVVDGNLNVRFGELITSAPQTIYAWAYGSSGSYFSLVSPGNEFRINPAGYVQPNADVSAFVSGANVTMPVPNVGTYTLVLTSNMVWNGQYWTVGCTVTSGGSVPNELRLYGYEGPVTVTSTIDTRVNALEVTEVGVNINGALTVNGDSVISNLSQISEDILPAFSEVYDIGSESKRFYDIFIANSIDINGAQLTGTEAGLSTDALVVTSLLAGDVLITDNIITPDNTVPAEYSGSNLGELVVNGNLTVSGDWLNVPVVETVTTETTSTPPSTTGVEGFIRFNKDTASFEGHNGTEWDALVRADDLTGYATESYVETAVNNLVDAAPGALNTLNELAAALNDDANFASTVVTALSTIPATARTAISYTDGSTTLTAGSDYPIGRGFTAVKDGAGFQYLSNGGWRADWPDLDVHDEFWNQPIGTVFTLTSLVDINTQATPGSFTFTTTSAPNGESYYGVFSAGLPIGFYTPASISYGGSPSPFSYNDTTGVLEYDTEFYSNNPLTTSELLVENSVTFPDASVQTTAYTGADSDSISNIVVTPEDSVTYTGGQDHTNGLAWVSSTGLLLTASAWTNTSARDTLLSMPVGTEFTVTPSGWFPMSFVATSGFVDQNDGTYLMTGTGDLPTNNTAGPIDFITFIVPASEITYTLSVNSSGGVVFPDATVQTTAYTGAVSYTPATAGDWNGTPPTTINEAIDRLAALVKTLNSGTGA